MTRTASTTHLAGFLPDGACAARGGGRCLAALTIFLFVSGCLDASGDPAIAQGRALYEANCMECHGERALGDGPLASTLPVPPPALKEHLGHHTRTQLVQLIQGGVPPAMPPSAVSEEEIRLIVDYLWTLVPESEVAALREMQQQMEMMGDSAVGSMPGMPGVYGTQADHTGHMPGMPGTPGVDSTRTPPMETGGSTTSPEAAGPGGQ